MLEIFYTVEYLQLRALNSRPYSPIHHIRVFRIDSNPANLLSLAQNYLDDSDYSQVLEQHYWTLRNIRAQRVVRQMFLLML